MFGQPNTPFGGGGGGFGQQSNTTPAFGSPAPAPGGLFGSPSPGGFGQAPAAFGQPAPAPSGFGGGFGAPAPTGGLFGAPAPAPTGFGGYGAPAPSSTFGSSSGGLFGNTSQAPAFGAPSTGFGQSPVGGGMFGQNPAPAPFGSPASNFGAPAFQSSAFGAPAPSAGLFGAPATTSGLFGSNPAQAPFAAAPSSLFGSAPTPSTGFGGSNSMFGGSQAPAQFGSPAPAQTGFGAPPAGSGGVFGSPPVASSASGTRATPYQVTSRQDGTTSINLQSISAMQQYQDQSHEELRFADYSQGNRGTAAPAPSAYGGFGAPAQVPPSLFVSAPAQTGGFGSTSGGLFGSTNPAPVFGGTPAPMSSFGQTPAAGGLFGQSPAITSFGAPASNFAAPATAFGAAPMPSFNAPAPSVGLFGTPAPAPGFFGGNSAPAPYASAPLGIFGGAPAPTPSFAPVGVFATNQAPAPYGLAPGGGLFGQTPAPPLFGQAPAPFGQTPSLFSAPAPAMFGGALPSFGAPSPGGLLGGQVSAPPAYGSPYGQAPPAQQQQYQPLPQPLFASNVQIVAPGVNEVIEQQLRAMQNQMSDLQKMDAWRGPKASTSPATTPTSLHASESFFMPNLRSGALAYSTPRSAAKIRPRGFAQSEPPKPSVPLSSTQRDNSGLMSPEAFVRSSQLNLVIRPDSLQRARKFGLHLENHGSPSPAGTPSENIQLPPTEEYPDSAARMDPSPSPRLLPDTVANATLVGGAPAFSPGYEYYQQVIGVSSEASNQPVTPAANGTSNEKSLCAPKLTKSGYQVSPPIEELSSMSEADLASLRSFTVERPGYGKVEWEGSVDVRGADLDAIVVIEEKDVSVYSMDEEKGTKPEEGTKLNRPAVITFYEIYPKEGARASSDVMVKFAKKVEKATLRMDADFVSYDSKTGVWRIRVLHFSRYALVDDDSDDENAMEINSRALLPASPQMPMHAAQRKATPYKPSRIIFDDTSESAYYEGDEADSYMVSDADSELVREAENAAKAIADCTRDDVFLLNMYHETAKEVTFKNDGEDDGSSSTIGLPVEAQPSRVEMIRALSGSSFCSTLSGDNAKVDSSRFCGRSFRVGWLPDGSFFKLKQSASAISPSLVKFRPLLSDGAMKATTFALLDFQLRDAAILSTGDDNCPLFSISRNCESIASSFSSHEDARHAFLFLARLFPLGGSGSFQSTSARRVASSCKLLLDLCAPSGSKKRLQSCNDDLSSLFDAFSSGDVESACDLAVEAGLTHLAAGALATSSGGQNDVARLLLLNAQSGDLSRLTNPMALRILRDASGEFKWEDQCFRKGDKGLDWRRRLVLRLLQNPDVSLLHAMQDFESAIAEGDVPYPHPRYLEGTTSQAKSLFFRLLRLCADPQTMTVCEAVDPGGYTPFLHDFNLSFHLASAISAASSDHNGQFKLPAFEAEYIIDGYEAQLSMEGAWEWAVFVSLCHIGDGAPNIQHWKIKRAKNLVLRHYQSGDRRAQFRRDFLERKVGVPSQWFEEALCYRAAANGDVVKCIDHACAFDLRMGREAWAEFVLPRLVLDSKADSKTSILEEIANEAPLDSLAMAMYRFFELDERVMALISRVGDVVDEDEVSDLLENFEYVHDVMLKLNELLESQDSTSSSPSALLVPVPQKMVLLSSLVSEALVRLSSHKIQLDAVSKA